MLQYVYAPLAVFTGLSMIFLYNGYSKNFAKKAFQTEQTAKFYSLKVISINVLSALMVVGIYAIMIWVKVNAILYITLICVLGAILEIFSKKVSKKTSRVYEGAALMVLALIRYVV